MATSQRIEAKRLKGFRDYTPAIMQRRFAIMDEVRRVAREAGFQPIGTPALEYASVLLGQGSEETDKQVYRFSDHGERDVALRFDLTVPFARYVAEHQGELVFPFKRLQMGDVWRGENPQKGRFREFCQCDLDVIGVDSPAADIEILLAFLRILAALSVGGFTMSLGHRAILSALIKKSLPALTEETPALIVLDKLAKIGREAVVTQLAALPGASADQANQLLELLTAKAPGQGPHADTDLGQVAAFLAGDAAASAALERLQDTVDTVRGLNSGAHLVIDLTIARGLGYYTGVVFETFLEKLPGFGSVCSGGRYDNLASRFINRHLPGVGGSVGLDRLVAALEELQGSEDHSFTKRGVFVAIATDDARAYAFRLAQLLRDKGITTDVALQAGKLGNQFRYADRMGYPFVITVGSDEVQTSTFALKAMASGEEAKALPLAGLVDQIENRLGALSL